MRTLTAILLCILTLAACQRDKRLRHVAANGITITENPYHWPIQAFNYEYVGNALPVYYIGTRSDSISIHDFPIPSRRWFSLDTPYDGNYPLLKPEQIELFVDTSVITYYSHLEYKRMAGTEEDEYITVSHSAHPVFMYNHGDSIFRAGEGNMIGSAIIEAMDNTGQWQTVVDRYEYSCGTTLRELILKPHGMLLAKYPIRQGDTYTRLRLKVSRWKHSPVIYSNEFWGWITFPPPAAL